MSIFFWILGILATAGFTFVVCYFLIGEQLCSEWMEKQKQLADERSNFKRSYDDAQQWYSRAWKEAQEKTTALNLKEKALEELKQQLEAKIIKNDQEKKESITLFHNHLTRNQNYVAQLEAQLANARQRAKRLAKQAKNPV